MRSPQIFVVLLTLLSLSNALKCHAEVVRNGLDDKLPPVVTCSLPLAFCWSFQSNEPSRKQFIYRGCKYHCEEVGCFTAKRFDVEGTECCCKGDFCNSGATAADDDFDNKTDNTASAPLVL
ncbi:hypothetical protein PENTCL1PPCAC_4991, partial [Pristionchus entomophagus]